MDWSEPEALWLGCPEFADIFVGCEAFEGLKASGEVVRSDEVQKVSPQLGVIVIVVSLDRRLLDGSVHSFDLAVGPRVLGLGEPMLDFVLPTDAVENVLERIPVGFAVGELDAVVGQHGVDCIWHRRQEVAQELGCSHFPSLFVEFDVSELRRAIDRHEHVELTFGGTHLGDIDVEVADRIALELLLARLVPLDLGQAGDIVALKAAVQ